MQARPVLRSQRQHALPALDRRVELLEPPVKFGQVLPVDRLVWLQSHGPHQKAQGLLRPQLGHPTRPHLSTIHGKSPTRGAGSESRRAAWLPTIGGGRPEPYLVLTQANPNSPGSLLARDPRTRSRGAAGSRCPSLLRRRLAVIVERGRFDFDVTREFHGKGRIGDRHWLLDALVRAVFPRGVDEDGVLAARQRLVKVVLAVPDDRVFARAAGSAATS